ncbi:MULTISPECIES: 5-carboxymethyl-2-hydroxymuconate Delta-isomerase [unclassified Sphingomonas]|uniref:5-carboxymethyl-2-hydroxymuconate Delta-isomerase n=1 Tax=unclassified Sphingomonas TaxID=196159 RepID=UPI0006F5AD69|nr:MULTISPECIES: 5-carboxymethyl-2-hydroxymuconate Delta-isomerase [unclassified Sphingomonas]KQX19132.1 5-carboxymethyl-2-hydroxymuconate isomerase [Sphingomonas sp. Root1294]KQY65333.1 5-carboxymethyl-2-hydroxymuconate isomerase [Sphingomonas sp. Root50]KRB95372.1 5-carboxymethyl-2-hydroxymuconate isomerase [Sphingomonas sp. Root720]
MAHAVVEWSDNLEGEADIGALLRLIAQAMRDADGVFPWGGIRVRGIKLTDYVIADDSGQDAFVNITIKIGAGRPAEFKRAFFGSLFERIKGHFAPLFERRYLALSMYVEEADEADSFKHNNIHARFKKVS